MSPDGTAVDGSPTLPGLEGRPDIQARVSSLPDTKRQILHHVVAHPGSLIEHIARAVDCSHNNAARHLKRLTSLGLLVRENQERGVRFYWAFGNAAEDRLHPYVSDPKRRRVIEFMVAQGSREWNVNQLAVSAGVYHTFLLRMLRRLERNGLVTIYRPSSRYYVKPTSKLLLLMAGKVEAAPEPAPEGGSEDDGQDKPDAAGSASPLATHA